MSTAQAIRAARKFAEAQAHYDNLAEPDYDEDALTEDEALELAEAEKQLDPGVLFDALHELCDPLDAALTLRDMYDDERDLDGESSGRLLVFALYGSLENRQIASMELRRRVRASLDPYIKDRAAELLKEQAA